MALYNKEEKIRNWKIKLERILILNKLNEWTQLVNYNIQAHNGTIQIYLYRIEDDSEITSIGGYDDVIDAIEAAIKELEKRYGEIK